MFVEQELREGIEPSRVMRSTVAVVGELQSEAEALCAKIHKLWETTADKTREKSDLGSARDKAMEAGFFLKDVAAALKQRA